MTFRILMFYMMKAAATDDPVERLKLISTMYAGGHFVNQVILAARSPLNPILGETIQLILDDGTLYMAE